MFTLTLTRVTILSGGKMAVVAAGSVVVKDVPDSGVYGGVPAKALGAGSSFVNFGGSIW